MQHSSREARPYVAVAGVGKIGLPLYSQAEVRAMGYMSIAPGYEDEISAIIVQAGHRVYQEFDFSRFPRCRVVLDGRRVLDKQRIEAFDMRYIAIGDGAQRGQPQEAEQGVQRSVSTVGGQC